MVKKDEVSWIHGSQTNRPWEKAENQEPGFALALFPCTGPLRVIVPCQAENGPIFVFTKPNLGFLLPAVCSSP